MQLEDDGADRMRRPARAQRLAWPHDALVGEAHQRRAVSVGVGPAFREIGRTRQPVAVAVDPAGERLDVLLGDAELAQEEARVGRPTLGLAGEPASWDVRATSLLMTRIIPIDHAMQELMRANPSLRSICGITVMRILGLAQPPSALAA